MLFIIRLTDGLRLYIILYIKIMNRDQPNPLKCKEKMLIKIYYHLPEQTDNSKKGFKPYNLTDLRENKLESLCEKMG